MVARRAWVPGGLGRFLQACSESCIWDGADSCDGWCRVLALADHAHVRLGFLLPIQGM